MCPRCRTYARLIGIVLAVTMANAGAADAAVEPEHRAPVMLYISGASAAFLPEAVAEVRSFAVKQLENVLTEAGCEVVPSEDLIKVMSAHRVRSSLSLSAAFLNDLGRDTNASHVLVAVLLIEENRLQLLSRLVNVGSKYVVFAECRESALEHRFDRFRGIDPSAWYDTLARLCGGLRLNESFTPPRPGKDLVLLPARALGCDAETALTAFHCLLSQAVQDTMWRALEPSLAVTVLQQEGIPYLRLDGVGRRSLSNLLGDVVLIAPEIMVYGAAPHGRRYRDADSGASTGERINEYELALRFLDPQSGVVAANFVERRPHGVEIGWFGIRKETSMLKGLTSAAATLWHQVEATLEDR